MNISKRVQVSPSETVTINSLAMKKKQAGEKVFNLSAGEPLMPTPQVILDAAQCALDADKTTYQPVAGIPELRFAMSQWMNRTYGTNFTEAETIVTVGGKFGVYALLQALLEPGDEALMVAPYWVSYSAMTELASGKPIVMQTSEDDEWKITPEKILEHCTEKTRVIILNNASNPTGVLYTREELKNILDVTAEKNLVVISDEVYSGLVYDKEEYISCGSFVEHRDRVVIVQSMSKHFGMTGWRVGFLFGPEEIIKTVTTIQGQSTTGTSSISQWAALGAIEHADVVVPVIRGEMERRRNIFAREFERVFSCQLLVPKSSLYFFIPMKAFGVIETDSVAFCTRMLEERNVAMVPGTAFGLGGYVRCSFGVDEETIVGAIKQLAANM